MNIRRMHFLLVSVFLALGGFAPKAQASAVLELIPDNTGPYFGGESLTVDVWLHSQGPSGGNTPVWRVQLDFAHSDPTLNLSPTFTFDLSSSIVPEDFQIQPDLPVPWAMNNVEYACPECRLQLPGDGSLHVGNLGVVLPSELGTYRLDALNAEDPVWEHGALAVVGGTDSWRAYTGEITGGVFDFHVIPEPATLSLLMLGAAAVVCRRRRARYSLGAICTVGVSVAFIGAVVAQPPATPSEPVVLTCDSEIVSASVLEEEVFTCSDSGSERISTHTVGTGALQDGQGERAICGSTDDREGSGDKRAGRMMHKGWEAEANCTAFLFDDRPFDFLTAGHCCKNLDFSHEDDPPIVQFNVHESLCDGTPTLPLNKEDNTYKIDPDSVQWAWDSVKGDWCQFGVSANRDGEGVSPLEQQGASYQLFSGEEFPTDYGSTLRITGYGQDNKDPDGCCEPTCIRCRDECPPYTAFNFYSKTRQTHAGPYDHLTETTVEYVVDTMGGNSGSAVEHEATGLVYAIHTTGGCEGGSTNGGTRIDNQYLRKALRCPIGVSALDCNDNNILDKCDIDCYFCDGCEVTGCGQRPDCNSNGVPDECDLDDCEGELWCADCDSNGIPDGCDIEDCVDDPLCDDCNLNQIPDLCDLVYGDCNSNGVPDECEIDADSTAPGGPFFCTADCDPDCNDTGVPDGCELTDNDCNSNSIPDDCDLADCDGDPWCGDCDENGVPDGCQPYEDCQHNGIQDLCDIAGCSGDPECGDCDYDGVPDGCQPFNDCNSNGIRDICDPDCNDNGVPDECDDPVPLYAPWPAVGTVHEAKKNRYLSVITCGHIALRVDLKSMKRCSGDDRRPCAVDADCPGVCTGDHDTQCTNDAICITLGQGTCVPSAPCIEHPDVGQWWWAGAPAVKDCVPGGDCTDQKISNLAFAPVFADWDLDAVNLPIAHITDCEIVPNAKYEIRACLAPDGSVCSNPVVITTIDKPDTNYGDVVGPVEAGKFTEPDGIVNVTDIQAYLIANANGENAPHTTWVDLHGTAVADSACTGSQCVVPQQILNIGDLQTIKFGFLGRTYVETPGHENPGDCPARCLVNDDCDDEVACTDDSCSDGWCMFADNCAPLVCDPLTGECVSQLAGPGGGPSMPLGGGGPILFTLVPSAAEIDYGQSVDVEVFIDSVDDLMAYEASLEVTGGDNGQLTLTDVEVDSQHVDYVFASAPGVTKGGVVSRRQAFAAANAGVAVTGPGYLATFTYQASIDARGTFQVSVRPGVDILILNDSDGQPYETDPGTGTSIEVIPECVTDPDCDDDNECTIDTCVDYECSYENASQGTSCDDGLFCTATDECDGNGTCVGSGSPCTIFQICLEASDRCVYPPPP